MLLIDAEGVLLEPPPQAQFAFPVLSGVRDQEIRRPAPRARARACCACWKTWATLAKDVSEVNAADPDNIRIVAQVEGRAVELVLGDHNFRPRYQNFLKHYPEIAEAVADGEKL